MPREESPEEFWDVLHAALGLQHTASSLAEDGEAEAAAVYEREAFVLLLEATCLLHADEPAMGTIRQLAVAGLARLHTLTPQSRQPAPRPRRKKPVAS